MRGRRCRKEGKKKEMASASRESSRERERDREALGAELPMYANGSVAQGDSGNAWATSTHLLSYNTQ